MVGAAIVAVFALIIFWPDGDKATHGKGGGKSGAHAAQNDGAPKARTRRVAGVEARRHDAAEARPKATVNPKIGPVITGMAPPPPPETIPDFANTAEEIAYWERKLDLAQNALAQRKKFADRAKRIVKDAPSAEDRKVAESRQKIVQDNYAKAQAKVKEIEDKLAGLRG